MKWVFEPGHTAAEFCVRHMMVSNVRGHFKNISGTLDFDPHTKINRHEFGVDWNAPLDHGGHVVGDEVEITIDVEALEARKIESF